MLPLQLDVTCESFAEYGAGQLEYILGPRDSDEHLTSLYLETLAHVYDVLIHYSHKVSLLYLLLYLLRSSFLDIQYFDFR